jgi:hypothetical protein
MKRLPLYDESADIACTITPDEVPARIELVEKMRRGLNRLERTEHGLLLFFAPDRIDEADVRRFASDEKRCCQFWGFAVEAAPETLSLLWDGPPSASPILERLAQFFTGDEPASTLSGLL